MERIYFDKQIFSHLFKGEKPAYQNFLSTLNRNKHRFLYCYSHAHLLDLKNDLTDIKYKELDFIETLVNDNYLSYHAIEKRTSCYLAKPSEAFKDIEQDEPISFSNIFDGLDLEFATPEQKAQVEFAKEILTNQKLDFGLSQIDALPGNLSEPLNKVLPIGLGPMTIMEWAEHFMGMVKTMEEDKSVYKGLRNVVDQNINNGKFTVDYESIDFNDDLKNSVLQKSFIEYVNNNLNPNGDKEVTDYDFYVNAYFTLDLLGISKEPSKTVKFKNVMNDGYHSYYGAFCDYVVSDDNGFLKKTKVLYKLLGIETKVYHIEEFIPFFNLQVNSFETDTNTFWQLLINDLRNGLVLDHFNSIKSDRKTTVIKPHHQYLGHFNRIESIKENGKDYILLRRKTKNYSYFSFYRGYEGIINNAITLFGIDSDFRGKFDWEKDIKEINDREWSGRFWNFGTLTKLNEINKGINEIFLLITPKNETE
jgi:hypothetical protein